MPSLAEPILSVADFLALSVPTFTVFLDPLVPTLVAVFLPLITFIAPHGLFAPFPSAYARFLFALIQDARVLALQFAFTLQFLPGPVFRQPPFFQFQAEALAQPFVWLLLPLTIKRGA